MAYLDINNVVKRYDGHTALAGVSMQVPEGCIYGLLGPNGAGKSTLIRIINRIIAADEGTVTLGGKAMTDDDITRIGYLPEERGLYKKMKVGDHIVYLGRLKGMTKADAVASMQWWLKRFDLQGWENKKVEALSKGMQQKVQFIATVIHRPPLLIFDEPFSGFDPVNAEQLKVEILALRDQGSTILFSTHNMASVEEVCQQITLLNHSQVVLSGSVDEVKQQHKKNITGIDRAQCPHRHHRAQRRPVHPAATRPRRARHPHHARQGRARARCHRLAQRPLPAHGLHRGAAQHERDIYRNRQIPIKHPPEQ